MRDVTPTHLPKGAPTMEPNAEPAPARRKPGPKPRDLWRVHVSVPGILWSSVQQRWAEFAYRAFTPFAIELVCFDLRKRHDHDVTQPITRDARSVQDAIDRQIVAHYRPNIERQYGLIDRLLNAKEEFVPDLAAAELPEVAVRKVHVKFPRSLRPLIKERWKELGYTGVSPYVTGLIRYDLMLCGPHKYFSGKDTDPAMLKELDALTEQAFRANRKQRILLDYLIERAVGRELTDDERKIEMQRLVQRLRVVTATGRRHGDRRRSS